MLNKKLKSTSKLISLFKRLNLKKNDNIIFHTNISGLYQYEKKININICKLFLKTILNYIGKEGTLLIPTYNYNFTKGKTYERNKTDCQVGLLGNILLKKFYKSRTYDPVFSHLVFGKLKKDLFNCDYKESFGDRSIFSKIIQKKFKIVCFCCSVNNITFIHYIEKKMNVEYRYNKYFFGNLEKKKIKYKYFVGKKKLDYSLKEKKILKLINNRQFRSTTFGKFNSYCVKSDFIFKKLKKIINKQNNYLIEN